MRPCSSCFERAAECSSHQGIHGNQTKGKSCQTQHASGSASQIGSEEEKGELAGGLRAYAVQNADEEDGFAGVDPLKALWARGLRVADAAHLPCQPQHAIDGDGQAAFDAAVGVAVRIFAQNASDDADAEQDKGEADEPLGPVVDAFGQTHVQLQDSHAQRGHGEGVAQSVRHAQTEAAAPAALHGSNVADGRQMVVVEAMLEPQQQTGTQRGINLPIGKERRHPASIEQLWCVWLGVASLG